MQEKIISKTILAIAKERGPKKSTCPSEIARKLFLVDWRKHMTMVREVAISLRTEGKILITQKGQVIETNEIRGPIRIKINT